MVKINEIKDIHGRLYATWVDAIDSGHELIDLIFLSTYTGATDPEAKRVNYRQSLTRDAAVKLISEIQGVL